MPYMIETTQSCGYCTHCGYGGERVASCLHRTTTRTAVATLDEARAAIRAAIDHARDDMRGWRDEAHAWTDARTFLGINIEIGGSIGPLPDGTVIEVHPATWTELAARSLTPNVRGQAAILAAFNAAA